MKVTFILGDRQSGKTTLAIYEAAKDPENTVVIGQKLDNAINMVSIGRKKHGVNLNYVSSLPDAIKGKSFKKVILDEFFFFKNYKEVLGSILPTMTQDGEIFIFSSFKDPVNDYKFVKSIYDSSVITLTENYRLMPQTITLDGQNIVVNVPKIIIEDFINSING